MFNFKIVTPFGEFFSDEVDEIVLRSTEGDFAILSHHIDKIAQIIFSVGLIKIKGKYQFFSCSGGLFTMFENQAMLISNYVKWEEIKKDQLIDLNTKLLQINEPKEIITYFGS